ncbi:YbjN domain-containing protein [Sanguibacter antarcticus]|uniref:Putative sensory transduction regulator n=1 Tax=Sanguibacter antarcticus TaxID=372484 RepID=A0A2A9E556_9MICO|nr:YbjN domain-containing protein [Sanguibacter antarcticus]PFG33495.1 putative sensory transduction regulator [Sanguibacter antarcticus]
MGFFRGRRMRRPGGTSSDHDGRAAQQPSPPSDARTDAELQADVESVLARELATTTRSDAGGLYPSPLSTARIVEWIKDYGYSYFIDSDGDVGGLWHSRLFYFLLFGPDREILQVRGQWNREITIDRVEEVLEFCNEWNTERIWPKAYFRVRDNGMIQVYGEVAVDLEHGASDDQLDQVLACGLSTGAMLFDALDELYRDPAQVAP